MPVDASAPTAIAGRDRAPPPPNPFAEFWSYFSENRGALGGLIVIAIIVFVAIFADFVAPHAYAEQYRGSFLRPPVWQGGGSWQFPLGTDDVGRDILSRLFYGARLSMAVGAIVIVLADRKSVV